MDTGGGRGGGGKGGKTEEKQPCVEQTEHRRDLLQRRGDFITVLTRLRGHAWT